MLRRTALALLLLSVSIPLFASDAVPLSTNIKFDPAANPQKKAITLVVSPDLSQLVVQKKMRLMRLDFPIGNAVAMNTESALRSAFSKVKLARTPSDVDTDLSLELKAVEVNPKMPMTTFGTFTSKVKYTYVLRNGKDEREIAVEGDGGNRKGVGRVLWDSGWKWTEAQQLAKATDLATVDALDQLLGEITK